MGSTLQQEMDQHAEHAQQERGAEEFRGAEYTQLGGNRFQQRQAEPHAEQLDQQHHHAQRQSAPVAGFGDAPGQEQGDADGGVGEQLQCSTPIRSGPDGAPNIRGSSPRGSSSVPGGWLGCPPGCARFPPAAPSGSHRRECHARVDQQFACAPGLDDDGSSVDCEIRCGEEHHQSAGSARKDTSISRRAPRVPKRDRAAAFQASGHLSELVSRWEKAGVEMDSALGKLSQAQLGETRTVSARPELGAITVRWCILHLISHHAIHLGHIQLTRQLWEQRLS